MTAEEEKALDIALIALEKQVPKKPIHQQTWRTGLYLCSVCGCGLRCNKEYHDNYCQFCGQRVDWSENNEKK
ncbi:MAG: hypothetical protein ACI4XP_00505 [Acutalibacteraceae bacterium]